MFIVRAVNIYPGQIDNVLSGIDGVGSEYQVIIDRVEGKDIMTLRVECVLGSDSSFFPTKAAMVKDAVKKKLLVTPEVEIISYGSLPRSERKTKRIFDKRDAENTGG